MDGGALVAEKEKPEKVQKAGISTGLLVGSE